MQYRRFGQLGFRASALGFGCMRLPIVGGDSRPINEPLAIEMIRYAVDRGVNYLDSAHGYHGGNHLELNRNLYRLLPEGARASACAACRTCEEKCPQKIAVSEWMPRIHEYFAK